MKNKVFNAMMSLQLFAEGGDGGAGGVSGNGGVAGANGGTGSGDGSGENKPLSFDDFLKQEGKQVESAA